MSHFFERRRQRKQLRELLAHARGVRNLREDILAPATLAALDAAGAALRVALRAGTPEEQARAGEALETCVREASPAPRAGAAWRENAEVLIVAFSVAMAFRCYCFQPFKIPTGSMQPTLYGIHSREQVAAGAPDRILPLKVVKWLFTGTWYREVRVRESGELIPIEGDRRPGYCCFRVQGRDYFVPADAVRERGEVVKLGRGTRLAAGDRLWSGVVCSGDHVFVNRIAWNFRRPRRGEVMVFATSGIAGLQQGTHYIKRMVGLPNETISVAPPNLLVDGRVVTEPRSIARVAGRARLADWAPPYAGYQLADARAPALPQSLRLASDHVALASDQYYAMGDNTGHSADSRYWGSVPERNLLGPACLVYWPFTSPRWGLID